MIFSRDMFVIDTGNILAGMVVEEHVHDVMQFTRHPVQQGAAITDHRYKEPVQIMLTVEYEPPGLLRQLLASGNTLNDALSSVAGALPSSVSGLLPGSALPAQSLDITYAAILNLQKSGPLFKYMSLNGILYGNMQIKAISRMTDRETFSILSLHIVLEQVIVVKPASVPMPASQQKTPEKTASPTQSGNVTPKTVDPATPNGSVLSNTWGIIKGNTVKASP